MAGRSRGGSRRSRPAQARPTQARAAQAQARPAQARAAQPAGPSAPPGRFNAAGLGWAGVVLVCLCAALAGLLEVLLVPLYIGATLVPIAVVAALVSNAVLPVLARMLVPSGLATFLPFLCWLIVVIALGVVSRPEGDVILPGAPGSVEIVAYAVLLGGALVGTLTVVTAPSWRWFAEP